MIGLRLLK